MEIVSGQNVTLHDIFSSSAWNSFSKKHDSNIRPVVINSVKKILSCRTEELGFATWACACGYTKNVPFTCKSRFCSVCGKVACDNWMNKVLGWSLPEMNYRHIVFTIPKEMRSILCLYRNDCLDLMFKASSKCLLEFFHEKYNCKPGIISVMHTFGKDIKWNPHVHVIITTGGLSLNNKTWVWCKYIHYMLLMKKWRYHMITEFRNWGRDSLTKNQFKKLDFWLDGLYRKNWYVNVGIVLESLAFTVKYIGRYAKRPVLAETRIKKYDGKYVSFSFKDKGESDEIILTYTAEKFIGKLIRHIPNKHYRMIRYSGIFANRTKNKYLLIVNNLLCNGNQKLLYAPKRAANWRERIMEFTGTDPCQCPKCFKIMRLFGLTFNTGYFKMINYSP